MEVFPRSPCPSSPIRTIYVKPALESGNQSVATKFFQPPSLLMHEWEKIHVPHQKSLFSETVAPTHPHSVTNPYQSTLTKVRFKSLGSIFIFLHNLRILQPIFLIFSANGRYEAVLHYDMPIFDNFEEEHDENEDEKNSTP